ncbi:unnamed protein product, partial [Ectocarpus fasciculatus]
MSEAVDAPSPPEPPAADANDYSRFNDLNMDSDSDDNAEALPSATPSHTVAESISLAAASKDTGNGSFKAGQFVEAKLHYDTAIKLLIPHRNLTPPAVGEQEAAELKSLMASLHGNSAMVLMKQEDWATATKQADHMLVLEPDNVKGLFRRGSCQRKMGNMEAARADMQRILELDPNNVPAKKELVELVKLIKQQKEKERATFAGAFSGSSMYADREQERAVKAKKLEDEKRKEQDEWTQSKLSRREQGLSEQPFEEWKKEREDKRKEAEKAAKAKAAPPAKPKTSSVPKKPKVENSDPDAEYDEEDAKLIKEATSKGYCYFRNQLDTETKELIGDIRPKALSSGEPTEATPAPAATVAASDWNHAGTWEERDFSQMVKTRLSESCLQASYEHTEGAARSSVTEVKKCEGEAQVVLTRGKKRHLYDYQMDLKFETKHGNSKYSGHLNFTDVSPGCN